MEGEAPLTWEVKLRALVALFKQVYHLKKREITMKIIIPYSLVLAGEPPPLPQSISAFPEYLDSTLFVPSPFV